jgi:hypothetical protein
MIARGALLLCTCLGLATVGCGGAKPSDKIDEYFDTFEAIVNKLCECVSTSSTDETQCKSSFSAGLPTSQEIACIKEVADENEELVSKTFDCYLDVIHAVEGCVNNQCTDPFGLLACVGALETDSEACPELPSSVQVQFAACTQ